MQCISLSVPLPTDEDECEKVNESRVYSLERSCGER